MGLEAIDQKLKLSEANREHRKILYLLRGVSVDRVNQVWVTDITDVQTWARLGTRQPRCERRVESRTVMSFRYGWTTDQYAGTPALRRSGGTHRRLLRTIRSWEMVFGRRFLSAPYRGSLNRIDTHVGHGLKSLNEAARDRQRPAQLRPRGECW